MGNITYYYFSSNIYVAYKVLAEPPGFPLLHHSVTLKSFTYIACQLESTVPGSVHVDNAVV